MRTNIEIDEKLIQRAIKASGSKTKKEAVERGLQALIDIAGQAEIRRLRGKLHWEGDLEAMRRDR